MKLHIGAFLLGFGVVAAFFGFVASASAPTFGWWEFDVLSGLVGVVAVLVGLILAGRERDS